MLLCYQASFETEHRVFKRFWGYNVSKKYGQQLLCQYRCIQQFGTWQIQTFTICNLIMPHYWVCLGKNKKTATSMIMMVRTNSSILNVNIRNTGKEKFDLKQCFAVKNKA